MLLRTSIVATTIAFMFGVHGMSVFPSAAPPSAPAAGGKAQDAAPKKPVTVVPVPRTDGSVARQDEVLKRAREGKAPTNVVFVGDSITQGWEGEGAKVWAEKIAPLGAMNLGVGGDRTEHVLWRLQQAPLGRLNPKAVVVMIGTNNAGGGVAPEEILEGVRAVVQTILTQAPGATVILLDIFPRGEKFNDMRGRILEVNQALSRVDAFGKDQGRVVWLPIGAKFLELDGSISKEVMPDQLHLSPRGYAIWESAVHDAIAKACAGTAAGPAVGGGAPAK